MDLLQFILTLDSTIRLSVVLLLACLAGLFSERSGIVDIGLEGKMLIAAFVAAAVAYESGSAWLGVLAGCAASISFAMIHGVASIIYRGDQIISGVALNFLASGLTIVIGHAIYKKGGQTPQLSRSSGGCSTELASACVYARSEKIQLQLILPAFRSCGCGFRR